MVAKRQDSARQDKRYVSDEDLKQRNCCRLTRRRIWERLERRLGEKEETESAEDLEEAQSVCYARWEAANGIDGGGR